MQPEWKQVLEYYNNRPDVCVVDLEEQDIEAGKRKLADGVNHPEVKNGFPTIFFYKYGTTGSLEYYGESDGGPKERTAEAMKTWFDGLIAKHASIQNHDITRRNISVKSKKTSGGRTRTKRGKKKSKK
jgi:hypothetical protein